METENSNVPAKIPPGKIPEVCRQLDQGRVSSSQLFKHRKELVIIHDSQEYRLRITGNDKLILTK